MSKEWPWWEIFIRSQHGLAHKQVLVNLGDDVPAGFGRFERVIEVVGLNDTDRQLARTRWRHYADRGYTITRHDLKLKNSP
jgi:DNA polymerase-3 subunit chi